MALGRIDATDCIFIAKVEIVLEVILGDGRPSELPEGLLSLWQFETAHVVCYFEGDARAQQRLPLYQLRRVFLQQLLLALAQLQLIVAGRKEETAFP